MRFSLRAFAAALVCRLLRFASRVLRRGGTATPGKIAVRICPTLLSVLAREVSVVAVTGTNGKTTCCRMIEEAFSEAGLPYLANRSGANLMSGITTEFVMNSTLFGRPKKQYAVIECDEAAARTVFGQLRPKVIVVNNLFRDQLDRYGEITHTLSNIREGIRSVPDALLCLNTDCSLCSSLAEDLPNRVLRFGIDTELNTVSEVPSDASHCIRCKAEYVYDYHTYAHLGGFRCPSCGYRREPADYAVTEILLMDGTHSEVRLRTPGGTEDIRVNLPAVYNLYNAVAALCACEAMGIAHAVCVQALGRFSCGFGRMEDFALGAAGAKMILVKNPAGCSQALEFLSGTQEPFALTVCLNDRGADGTDISWIWDANFELLAPMADRIRAVYVSGDRAEDMQLRLKYAGLDDTGFRLIHDQEALVDALAAEQLPIYIMPTYTAMLELRSAIVRRCGGAEFWE
ncbi:MAG: MurT ligase domain-containing protein [Oscillospiraceae bacterium]|nr:MurT ligase domain-containing protein [Oscillospiraceae bacterium]